MSSRVITIDGPGGSGKGTVCQRVARELGWHLLDSGSLYRLVGLAALRRNEEDADRIAAIAENLDVVYEAGEESTRIRLEGEDVTDAIRAENVGRRASEVAAMPAVREALLQRQRQFAQPPGLVADGRDMGTVVFPRAPLKLFLTATAAERAKRRYKQLIDKGIDANLPKLVAELEIRDRRDAERETAPMVAADDAVTVDTTDMSIDEVTNRVMQMANERFGNQVVR